LIRAGRWERSVVWVKWGEKKATPGKFGHASEVGNLGKAKSGEGAAAGTQTAAMRYPDH